MAPFAPTLVQGVLTLLSPQGSVCAFTESILRNYGLKTGFYRWAGGVRRFGGAGGAVPDHGPHLLCPPPPSSPHLVQVRERIRINGQPISKDLFSKYFWLVYNRLEETKVRVAGLVGGASSPGTPPSLGLWAPVPVGDALCHPFMAALPGRTRRVPACQHTSASSPSWPSTSSCRRR